MTSFPQQQITFLLEKLRSRGLRLVVAESCTGGMVASTITSVSGSSDVFECGFVTYSNESKTVLLNVSQELIAAHGAVSAEVAEAMLHGAIKNTKANVAVSVTGIAGPNGGSAGKPVGLVFIGTYFDGKARVTKNNILGGREEVRLEATARALSQLSDIL